MSRASLCLAVLVTLLGPTGSGQEGVGLPYTYADGTVGALPICAAEQAPAGARISLFDLTTLVDGNATAYVAHGWSPCCLACFPDMDAEAVSRFAVEHCRFELHVNGQVLDPSCLNVFPVRSTFEEGRGWTVTRTTLPEATGWSIGWRFEFPASSLAPGIYIFEGQWIWDDAGRCCVCPSSSDGPLPGASVSRVSTVTVVRP